MRNSLKIRPLANAPFGVEVVGLRPEMLDTVTRRRILEACSEGHGLVCFVFDRLLTKYELHQLTEIFGDSEFAPGVINIWLGSTFALCLLRRSSETACRRAGIPAAGVYP